MTNIRKRIISGIFLALVVLTAVLFSQILLNFLLATLAYLMYKEWHNMTKTDERLLFIGMFIVFIPLGCI
ncbi:MAG: phosphatidate cytidylyltransferase, partial [Rickettsiaceae bacterium]|nr:phosphatidate cytidylyltransferase [Rickettsiaceae bacterium]